MSARSGWKSRFRRSACTLRHVMIVSLVIGLFASVGQTQDPLFREIEPEPQDTARKIPRERVGELTTRDPLIDPEKERQVWGELPPPSPETLEKLDKIVDRILDAEVYLDLNPGRSRLYFTKEPVWRFSITNPSILDFIQFTPTEFELIAGAVGETTMTLWFGEEDNPTILARYLVRVRPPAGRVYGEFEERLNELFPNSMIQLIPVLDKLMVRGQARTVQEAGQILSFIQGQQVTQLGELLGPGGTLGGEAEGLAAPLYPGEEDILASRIINMLDVPGEEQIMLKVRIADLTRTALRGIGTDLAFTNSDFSWTSMLGVQGAFSAVLTTEELQLTISAGKQNSYSKILAEPNLITLNGTPATFNVGGSFAVPTVVGVGGAQAATTSFQSFGTTVQFTPTIIDKDRIRLQVQPSISQPTSANTVGGVPGLSNRSVSSIVDLREGQWLAIAGLIQHGQAGSKARVPILGDIPILDTLFSDRSIERVESELVILVSPEFVDNMTADQVPLILPGMEVTEPNDWQFFLGGRYEGDPHCDFRSTTWPVQQREIFAEIRRAWCQARLTRKYRKSANYYVQGDHGFSH